MATAPTLPPPPPAPARADADAKADADAGPDVKDIAEFEEQVAVMLQQLQDLTKRMAQSPCAESEVRREFYRFLIKCNIVFIAS